MGDGWSLMPDLAIKMGPDFLAYKTAYTDTAGYRGGQLLTDHATDKKTITYKGSNHIPMLIGSRWFFSDADQSIVIPADLDDYLADSVVEDGTGTWTASANVTASTDTGQVKLAIAAGFTTGLVGYRDISAVDMSVSGKNAISFLIKSSILLRHGDLQLLLDETSACASADETLTIPGLKANTQTRVILSFASAASARNAIISLGLNATRDFGAADIWIDDIKTTSIEAGKDYCVYACDSGSLTFKVSKATTFPSAFTADNSRKIGGFHTLCQGVGTVSGHSLTGYDTADIIPYSIWDLKHRPRSNPAGMTYAPCSGKWVDIYLVSGTGASALSVNGGTISDTRNWMDFVDDACLVKKRLLTDSEFQETALGSNEKTNVNGGADAVTTGLGHVDSAGCRMVSNIGCEDMCGVMWQWLDTQSYRYDPNGTSDVALQVRAVTHAASPGGNPVYLKYGQDGDAYLCCNMAADAVDKFLTFGTAYRVIIKHDASAATGGLQVYFDDDGTAPNRLLVNNTLNGGKDVYIMSNNADYWLPVIHNANAATTGVAISFDDGSDERLEGTLPGAANANLDLSVGTGFGWQDVGGNKGSYCGQGSNHGDVKLSAGGSWSTGSSCGSRSRYAGSARWRPSTVYGARFASEPL